MQERRIGRGSSVGDFGASYEKHPEAVRLMRIMRQGVLPNHCAALTHVVLATKTVPIRLSPLFSLAGVNSISQSRYCTTDIWAREPVINLGKNVVEGHMPLFMSSFFNRKVFTSFASNSNNNHADQLTQATI
eukprot:scaffold4748_cov124-Skeletonema_dohrnii-CCMP3373.AAC.4